MSEATSTVPAAQLLASADELLVRAAGFLPDDAAALTELRAAIESGDSDRIEDAVYDVRVAMGEGDPRCLNCGRDIDEHGYCSSSCYHEDNFDPEAY